MGVRKFIIATNQVDSDGDLLKLEGVKILGNGKVPLLKDFDLTQVLGEATITVGSDNIQAEADIPEQLMGCYPSIGFELVKFRNEGSIRVIEEMKLHYVGICVKENVDPNVKSIQEQSDV